MRVHELAKELALTSKELIAQLQTLEIAVKNHMSALTEEQEKAARNHFVEQGNPPSSKIEDSPKPPISIKEEAPKVEPPPTTISSVQKNESKEIPIQTSKVIETKTLTIKGSIIVKDFAVLLGLRPNQLIAELMGNNVFASINEKIDLKIAKIIAAKHGFELEHEKKTSDHKAPPQPEHKKDLEIEEDKPEDLSPRPPVVAFLGHVDHGKTSLLDYIRKAQVAHGESGGITQHIGAYSAEIHNQRITFLDTPGHAAFTAMRARGAHLTDIVILIVAADDGIMPQTREAIQHAKAANVTMMVAINKIDLPKANVDKVKQQLQQEGLTPEDWGGDLICVPVSAQSGEGIDQLLEMILLQSEVLELNANHKKRAQGYIIEARLEAGMGPTASILIRGGTIHVGDAVVCGHSWGKIKALINDKGKKVKSAGPSEAVKCLGLIEVPDAGAEIKVVRNDRTARAIAEERQEDKRTEVLSTPKRASLEDLLREGNTTDKKELSIILKADVQGSLEALAQSLNAIQSEKASLNIILQGVGNITANDVLLASASNAIIMGFHVSKDSGTGGIAKREGVEIRLYSIIYELLDDVHKVMTGLLDPEVREVVLGHAEILQVFGLSKRGRAAGCMVTDGKLNATAKARVKRSGDIVFEGSLASLKRFQNDATEVREGQECGIRLNHFMDYQVQDIIELYETEKVAQEL